MEEDRLVTFARTSLGDEFCLTCYKSGLGLANQKDADRSAMTLVATRKFTFELGRCKKCGKTGIMLRAKERVT
jgi:hypothetical protein